MYVWGVTVFLGFLWVVTGCTGASRRTTWLWYQTLIGGDELMPCVQAQSNVERERDTEWGRLTDRGWHVPMSINSPERLIVRNKALYTSHSDKRRSTGTTRHCVHARVCVSDKVYYVCSLSSGPNRHTPETLPKHLISICTLSLSLFPTLLPPSCPPHSSLCLPCSPPSSVDSHHFWKRLQRQERARHKCGAPLAAECTPVSLLLPLFTLWSFYNSPLLPTAYTSQRCNLASSFFRPPACVVSQQTANKWMCTSVRPKQTRRGWICFGLVRRDKILITPPQS